MSLIEYKTARPWAKSIREAVLAQKMPPWFADPRFGHFSNDARLSATEVKTIQAWADGGAPEGNVRDLPPAPVCTEGWQNGKPDLGIVIGDDHALIPGGEAYEHCTVR